MLWLGDAIKLTYLHLGLTGFDLVWVLTLTGLGPGLLLSRTRRDLHLAFAIVQHLLSVAMDLPRAVSWHHTLHVKG